MCSSDLLKISGALDKFSGDYLQISEENVSIDKSNAFIDRGVNKKTKILENGEYEITLEIKRTQNRPKSLEYIEPSNGTLTYLIKENRSDIRLAIPKGSVIINDQSTTPLQTVGNEGAVDIYEFKSFLQPLQPANYTIKYKLPFRVALKDQDTFSITSLVQLQNGGWPFDFTQTLEVPNS